MRCCRVRIFLKIFEKRLTGFLIRIKIEPANGSGIRKINHLKDDGMTDYSVKNLVEKMYSDQVFLKDLAIYLGITVGETRFLRGTVQSFVDELENYGSMDEIYCSDLFHVELDFIRENMDLDSLNVDKEIFDAILSRESGSKNDFIRLVDIQNAIDLTLSNTISCAISGAVRNFIESEIGLDPLDNVVYFVD